MEAVEAERVDQWLSVLAENNVLLLSLLDLTTESPAGWPQP